MRRALGWGLGLYTVGAFAIWVLVGAVADWRSGTKAGAIVALFGVAVYFITVWLNSDSKFGETLLTALVFAGFPIGLLAWANGAPGYVWWWTTLYISGGALILVQVIRFFRWLEKKYGT